MERSGDQMIHMVNRLQVAGSRVGMYRDTQLLLHLPQIAVIGCQGAGRYKMLENIVGRKIFPRGTDILAWRPLIVQLISSQTERIELLHVRHRQVFTDFDLAQKELKAEMKKVKQHNKLTRILPVILQIHSPNVLNLTLVTLPCITKAPVGDVQPSKIRKLLKQFISKETCLILVVCPAVTHLTSSDAFTLAKEVDPLGRRTIGVITKLDLMEDGTDVRNILENNTLPLRRDFIGIVNRSETDPGGNIDRQATIAAEREFILCHPAYRHMVDRMGTPYLQRVLNEQLTIHIRDSLPQLRNRLQSQLLSVEKEVKEFKYFCPDDPSCNTKAMLELIQNFSSDFEKNLIMSKQDSYREELTVGDTIQRIFNEQLPYEFYMNEVKECDLRNDICLAIRSTIGVRTESIDRVKKLLLRNISARKQIETLRNPMIKCCDMVMMELNRLVNLCTSTMRRFPRLQEKIRKIVKNRIAECAQKTKEQLILQIEIQTCFLNLDREEFTEYENSEDTQENRSKENMIIRKGWLMLENIVSMNTRTKKYWFVLKMGMLYCFEDRRENHQKFMLSLDKVLLREKSTKSDCNGNKFVLFDCENRDMFKNYKLLELSAESKDGVDSWKASFLRAGVYPDKSSNEKDDLFRRLTPQLQADGDMVYKMCMSYMKGVNKLQRDLVPKILMFFIIDNIKEFIRSELLAYVYAEGNVTSLMEEAEQETGSREEIVRMYQTIQDALKIIRNLSFSLDNG